MKKIPLKYLPILGITLVLTLITFYLIKAGRKAIEPAVLTELISEEGLKNIHFIQDNPDEGARWVLDADEGKVSKDRQYISFYKFRLKFEPENDFSLELVGTEGNYNRISNEIKLEGGLEAYTGNGYRITTEHILFNQEENYLKTEAPVEITGPLFSVKGRGLQVNLESETIKILYDVTTLIDKRFLVL